MNNGFFINYIELEVFVLQRQREKWHSGVFGGP